MDLYRFYDADDRLLYVGISLNAAQRASQHRREKPWWDDVDRMDIEHLGDVERSEAERIERQAIIKERPAYNVTHARSRGRRSGSPPDGWNGSMKSAWRCEVCRHKLQTISGPERGYVQVDKYEEWHCVCRQCDDDSSSYWIDASRIATPDDVRRWTSHLSEKRWFDISSWAHMLKNCCLIDGAERIAFEEFRSRSRWVDLGGLR